MASQAACRFHSGAVCRGTGGLSAGATGQAAGTVTAAGAVSGRGECVRWWVGAHLPEGFRSEMKGIRSETRWKSSSVSGMPTECAMAMRCRTALVEPPVAMTQTIAFSNAARVMMSRGLMSFFSSCSAYRPAILHHHRRCRHALGMGFHARHQGTRVRPAMFCAAAAGRPGTWPRERGAFGAGRARALTCASGPIPAPPCSPSSRSFPPPLTCELAACPQAGRDGTHACLAVW